MPKKQKSKSPLVLAKIKRHFGKIRLDSLIAVGRTFPVTSRADLQVALEQIFAEKYKVTPIGIHPQYSHEALSMAHLTTEGHYPPLVGPLQHDEVDIGTSAPVRCLHHGLWLGRCVEAAFMVLLTPAHRFGEVLGVKVEIAVPPGEEGANFSHAFFAEVEELVNTTGSYRGKVISLERVDNYSGHVGVVRVHKLRSVNKEEVILPNKTLELLVRNVTSFVKQRKSLRRLDMPVKKGLLFYGPPGTGKTHTIHYLAGQLEDHTTLLITAEQVGLLDRYIQLARFLQPAMVVIEDVDLIARDRTQMHSPCEESLLNKLLNEMDGLREDAEILFVLTTNRPEQLEAALASRPGRIDQAIEFPLPDEDGRRKLIQLYARGIALDHETTLNLVARTRNASAAFIKELMRRSAQYYIDEGAQGSLRQRHLDAALEEMLFSGGSLNLKLLGADPSIADSDIDKEELTTKFRN
jgi:hypothetical protein